MPISAKTALCGIVLHPVGHTRSPAMHNAAFAALGLDAAYLAFDVLPENLGDALLGARALGVRQLAVSIPHKVEVMQYLDEVDETAQRIGAVNTVTRRGDRLVGTNTDCVGAVRALERETDLAGCRAVVLGAGGAARAVVYGLVAQGATVTVLNRTEARAKEVAQALGAESGPLDALASLDYNVLVNTTSVGLRNSESVVDRAALRADTVVMDAVYDPEETQLLRDAASAGAHTIGGKWMLVYQAAEQLYAWSEHKAPLDCMAAAFDAAGQAS